MLCTYNVNIKRFNLQNKNIDKHIVLKFLRTAVMDIFESYVLDKILLSLSFKTHPCNYA
ncbi:TetR family transcriptional regulator [Bacillus thuringiensis]|uniref:TetR family transcriptional regulator n=1 Tax=Bacillus thuringiensis TaxID=1428 RepID=UPI000BF2D77E|nr:TetR family transcriptional regulator [Bacillus thuringiensis]PFC46572.1 TetR family transcriptional regulator [Bacillus thuringiensis]